MAAIVKVRTVGGYATRAGYRLYHFSQTCASAKHRDCPVIAVMVSPNRPGAKVTVDLLGRVRGAWRVQGTTTARLGPASSAGILFFYDDGSIIGRSFEIRAAFGDPRNADAVSRFVRFTITA